MEYADPNLHHQQYHQQQQQDQQHYQQPYDPSLSQTQTHGQHYDPYYAYHYYDPSSYQHQQYYPQGYSSSAAVATSASALYQPPPPGTTHSDLAPAPPTPHDPSQIGHQHYQNHQDVAPAPPQEHQEVTVGLNAAAAAAVAALSQLTQFAGTMDAAERAMAGTHERQWTEEPSYPQTMVQHGDRLSVSGRASYRGGHGRRGGGSRGGRGNFGLPPSRHEAGAPPFRGRGRGRGRGRAGRGGGKQYQQSAPDTKSTYPPFRSAIESSSAPDPVQAPGQVPSVSVVAPPLPRLPLLPIAWCDICRVDCNSLEILEQHKNGKRHKKTVQRIEQMELQQKLITDLQAKGELGVVHKGIQAVRTGEVGEVNRSSTLVGEVNIASVKSLSEANKAHAQVSDEAYMPSTKEFVMDKALEQVVGELSKASASSKNIPPESNIGSEVENKIVEATSICTKDETVTEASKSEVPPSGSMPTETPARESGVGVPDKFDRKYFTKRKVITKFGRGGKRLRTLEPAPTRLPPPRPKEQPRVCTLCNVTCDTLAVFDCHLSGKKHVSRMKRFQGLGTVYGPISVYIPPNQPTIYPSHGPEPVFYGLKSHEMLQQDAYGLNNLPLEFLGPNHRNQSVQTMKREGAILEYPFQRESETKENEVPPFGTSESVDERDKQGPASREGLSQPPMLSALEGTKVQGEIALAAADVIPAPNKGDPVAGGCTVLGLGIKEELSPNNGVHGSEEVRAQ